MEFIFDDIESCECIGSFENEYVYDIEVGDDTHTFIANGILVHNSLYSSYDNLLSTVVGIENMGIREKLDIIVGIALNFLDDHNEKFMTEYYKTRYVDSVQKFELETCSLSGCWLDVKKRYAQILLWKDGKYFDMDHLKMKVKGLEMVKASYPNLARKQLTELTRYVLEHYGEQYLVQNLNILVQQKKSEWMQAELESICGSIKVNGYTKYVIDDKGQSLVTGKHCPIGVTALGNYNQIKNFNKLPGENIYGGKIKYYYFRKPGERECRVFAFQSQNYPKWGSQYAPVDRAVMFQKCVLDPINRIIAPSGLNELSLDGSIQMNLF